MDRWLITVCDKHYQEMAQNLVQSLQRIGWPYRILVMSPDTSPQTIIGAENRVVRQTVSSPVFDDPRWLFCQAGLEMPPGDEIAMIDADILAMPGFEHVFECIAMGDLASPVWNIRNGPIASDTANAERLMRSEVPMLNAGIVLARLCPSVIRFFRIWQLAAFASAVVGRGTVCAFQMAMSAWEGTPLIIPHLYHCNKMEEWVKGEHRDARMLHFAGRHNRSFYPLVSAEVLTK